MLVLTRRNAWSTPNSPNGADMFSAPVRVGAAPAEPVTLDQVKTFLRIDEPDLDTELELMIAAAREGLELQSGLRLIDQVVRVIAETPADLDHLTVGPVRDIIAIGTAPGAADAFELTGADLARGIRPVGNWPAGLKHGPLAIDLAVGYGAAPGDVPATLRLAVLLLVRQRYDDRPADLDRLLVNYRLNA